LLRLDFDFLSLLTLDFDFLSFLSLDSDLLDFSLNAFLKIQHYTIIEINIIKARTDNDAIMMIRI